MMFRDEFEQQELQANPNAAFLSFDAGMVHGVRCEDVLVYSSQDDADADEAEGDNSRALGRRTVIASA